MARRTRRRYYRRRSRWSPNIQELNNLNITTDANTWVGYNTLATNPVQSILGVSQTFTVKNFEVNFTIEADEYTQFEAITAYIMFVPQGMQITQTYNLDHPEYILNYKYLGSPNAALKTAASTVETQQFQPIRVRSRLSRKLNTGDSIILFIKGQSENVQVTSTNGLNISGLIRWWSKAN